MMKSTIWPLAFAVAIVGCGSGSKNPPNPGGDPGAGGQGGGDGTGGGGPIGGGPDPGDGDPSACSRLGEEQRLSAGGGAARMPNIVHNDGEYFVVWSDERTGNGDIYGAKLDADGKKLSEVAIVEGAEDSRAPWIARLGDGYLLTWFDKTPIGGDVKSVVLDANGRPDGTPAMLAPTMSDNPRPTAVSAFGGVAVAWSDKQGSSPTASVAWVNSSGQLARPAVSLGVSTASADLPGLAAGDDMLAAFYTDTRDGNGNIRVTIFNDQLQAQSDTAVREATNDAYNVRATWDAGRFFAAWEDLRNPDSEQLYVSRVSPDGSASEPAVLPESGSGANWPSLAATPSGVAIAYYQFRSGPPQIFISFIDKENQFIRPDLQISQTTGRARFPSIASDGQALGVAWEDTRTGTQQVYFARARCP